MKIIGIAVISVNALVILSSAMKLCQSDPEMKRTQIADTRGSALASLILHSAIVWYLWSTLP